MTDSNSTYGTYSLHGWRKLLIKACSKLGRSWLHQRLAFILRKIVLSSLSSPIIDAETAGFTVRFYPLDNVSDRFFLFLPQVFDTKEQDFLAKALRKDSVFVDIGANSGFYTLFAGRRITTGKILAIEPHPEMVERLIYNIQLNELADRVIIKPIGIADQEKVFNLSINPTNLGGNSIALTHDDKPDYLKEQIEIRCKPLLSVLEEEKIQQIDLLKIDIEEAEHLALIPFFTSSRTDLFPRYIIIESDDKIDLTLYGYTRLFSTRSQNSIYTLVNHG